MRSAVLIYEGFDGYDTTLNGFREQAPTSNTIGLGTDDYSQGGNVVNGMTASSTGMTFGSLEVNGGKLSLGQSGVVASAKLASTTAALSPGSTLYVSYLVNFSTISSAGNDGFALRLSNVDGTPVTAGPNTTNNAIFYSFPISRASGSDKLAVSYDNSSFQGPLPTPGSALSEDVNYMILSKYTNVGSSLTVENPGVAEVWALTESQFESFVASGRDDSWLDLTTNVSGYASETLTAGTFNLSSDYHLQIVSVNQVGSMDEIRFGTSYLDVTPVVPEPSRALFLTMALAGLLWHRRR